MLSLVLPTYNEAENLPLLLPKLQEVLAGIPHEIIVVDDDSPDGTWRRAQELVTRYPSLKVIRRQGERGLSSAVMTGFRAARGEVLAVMDADGQHDSALLRQLYETVRSQRGMAVATRYMPGGSTGQWNERRKLLSRTATRMVMALCHIGVRDPLSGFFAIDRSLFERTTAGLKPRGFKILFDLLVRLPKNVPISEIPYTFAPRLKGRSKLSVRVHGAFLLSFFGAMLRRNTRASWVICVLCLLCGAVLLWRAWNLRLLVLDPAVRERTRQAIQSLNTQEGWLVSDLTFRWIERDRIELLYHPHGRFSAPSKCIRVKLNYFNWYPCDAS
ncbi:MAG: polyprenol monophosphomannose synthase [Candidatus Peribacteraceae bacterium]|nr:polyprenol monophosphomannose synthase [Candidatus Peribacteraceae bacterium]MDD5074749.1 polyprenol monophosphomannose synthase [Candidatus Peribacteraceae bacterium]